MRRRLTNFVLTSSLLALAFVVSTTSAKADNLSIYLSGPGGTLTCADGRGLRHEPFGGCCYCYRDLRISDCSGY